MLFLASIMFTWAASGYTASMFLSLLAFPLLVAAPVALPHDVILTTTLVVSGDVQTGPTEGAESGGATDGADTRGGGLGSKAFGQQFSSSSSYAYSSAQLSLAPSLRLSSASSTTSSQSSSSSSVNTYAEQWKQLSSQDALKQTALLDSGVHISLSPGGLDTLDPNLRALVLQETVHTLSQLQLFVRALLEEHSLVRSAEIRTHSLMLSYRADAWLMGFIPVQYLLAVEIHDDGSVRLHGPWWLLLSRDNVAVLQSTLSDALTEASKAQGEETMEELVQRWQNVLRLAVAALEA